MMDFSEGYKEGTEKIKDIDLRIYDSSGKLLRKVKEKEIEDYALSEGLISDGRVKYFDFESSSYPVTVEQTWTITSESTMVLPMDSHSWPIYFY